MLFLKKLSIYLLALVNLYLFFLLLKSPERIWYLVVVIAIALFLVTKFVIGKRFQAQHGLPAVVPGIWKASVSGWKEFFIFFSFILLFILSSVLFLLIIENIYLKYIIIFAAPILVAFYLQLIFGYLYSSHKYQPFSLVNFFNYTSLIILFFASTGLFTLNIFLTLSFLLTALIISALVTILVIYDFWINKFEIKKYYYYFIIIFLLIFELSALLTWWPINYYLKGFLITIFYFLFNNLINKNIKQVWNKKRVVWLVVIVLIIAIVSLVTARWL